MQKLKLYVKETKRERRELTEEEHLIVKAYSYLKNAQKAIVHEYARYLIGIGFDHSSYCEGLGTFGSAEFETTTEREATDDEFWAWLDYKKECIRIGVEYFSPMRDELKDKEFRIEVVEE